jgi:RNA polymerase sigma factor (sigma-70 family)
MSDYTGLSDAELLRAAARDPQTFGELYDRYAVTAYRWARSAGLDEADALDLVAELFARVWISRRRFRDPGDGSVGGWLYGIARNLTAAYRRRGRIERRARRRLGMPPAVEPDGGPGLADRLDAEASRGELAAAMAALPERYRRAVQMRVVDELAYPELAARLACTETTARKRVSLGLRLLRERLTDTR